VDSEELAAPVHPKKVNEIGVGGDWEIINETTSKGDDSLPKSSTTPISKVTREFVSAHSSC